MLSIDWQIVVVAACVLWAVAIVARRGYTLFQQPSASACGSGGCHGCPSGSSTSSGSLIQLDRAVRKADFRN
jgi:hypothetical protein